MHRKLRFLALLLALAAPLAAQRSGELAPIDAESWSWEDARHLLFRAGWGGTEAEIDALHALGLEGAVDHLVNYEPLPKPEGFAIDIPEPIDFAALRAMSQQERQRARQMSRRKNVQTMNQLRLWWLRSLVETKRPLEEKMTFFWHGHFTSGFRDVRNAMHMCQQNDLLREHATGSFADLVHAIAKDAAMLEYLDNNRNRKQQPNENFARELMELFTLGVDRYTEADIKEAARAFTGWTFDPLTGAFVFNARQHDDGEKTFLGRKGAFGGEDIVEIILEQPRCAEYVAERIFRFFVHDRPSQKTVETLAAILRKERKDQDGARRRYEIKPVLAAIFRSRAFYSDEAKGTRIKSPVELCVGAVRQLELSAERTAPLLALMSAQMGQTLFDPPNVKGWAGGRDWISTSSLYDRYNFAGLITRDLSEDSFRIQPPPVAMAEGDEDAMSSGAVGDEVMGDTVVPVDEEAPEAQRRARGTALIARLRNQASQTQRAMRLRFPFRADDLVRDRGLKTPEEIVSHFARVCLAVELPEESRAELVDYLNTNTFGEAETFDLERWDASRRLKGMLHLLFSSPEYQLN